MLVLFLLVGMTAVITWDALVVSMIRHGAKALMNAGRVVMVIEQGLTVDGELS